MTDSFPTFLGDRVRILTGDITTHDVAAIVNAANSTLLGGGGVDGAIHRTGGPQILAECKQIRETTHPNGLPTGEAVITTGGNLSAQYVIHTVGPIYGRRRLLSKLVAARMPVRNFVHRFSLNLHGRVRISQARSRRDRVPVN